MDSELSNDSQRKARSGLKPSGAVDHSLRAVLKETVISMALECNLTPQELEFYTWWIWALGLQKC